MRMAGILSPLFLAQIRTSRLKAALKLAVTRSPRPSLIAWRLYRVDLAQISRRMRGGCKLLSVYDVAAP
jgi:hypothetical protein